MLLERRLTIAYIAETEGRAFLLTKGYKPALEALVVELGYADDWHGNRLLITLPEEGEEDEENN